MEISVRLDIGSGFRDPANSIRLSDDLGDLWPPISACLKCGSFLALESWNFCAAAPLSSGFGVLRGWTEGFGDWSTSSTSKDLFNASKSDIIPSRCAFTVGSDIFGIVHNSRICLDPSSDLFPPSKQQIPNLEKMGSHQKLPPRKGEGEEGGGKDSPVMTVILNFFPLMRVGFCLSLSP